MVSEEEIESEKDNDIDAKSTVLIGRKIARESHMRPSITGPIPKDFFYFVEWTRT